MEIQDSKAPRKSEKVSFDPAEGWDNKEPPCLSVPPKNLIWSLIKNLSPGAGLHRVTLPVNILEPRSLLEAYADCNRFSKYLTQAIKQPDPLQRIIGIVRWYLSPFRLKSNKLRKPYNPILGEVFCCTFNLGEDGLLNWYSEQVSHHPPISAFYMENKHFTFNGSIHSKSKYMFPTAMGAYSEGYAILKLKDGEEYRITYPSGFVPNILRTDLQFELFGNTEISCEKTGLTAKIKFMESKNPYFGSKIKINTIKGTISNKKGSLYEISGTWDDTIYIKAFSESVVESANKNQKIILVDNVGANKIKIPMVMIPLKNQQWYESRKLWQNLTRTLWIQDEKASTDAKVFIEERQRALRKNGKEGTVKLFKKVSKDNEVQHYRYFRDEKLAPMFLSEIEEPKPNLKPISFSNPDKEVQK